MSLIRTVHTLSFSGTLALAVVGCPSMDRKASDTRLNGAMIVAELNALAQRGSQLPESLQQLCPLLANCWGKGRALDGWSRPFLYDAPGTAYRLRSLGADGNPETADDIDFSPSTRSERSRSIGGCWSVDSGLAEVRVRRVWFDTVVSIGGEFPLKADESRVSGSWAPWTADSIVASLSRSASRTDIAMRSTDDRLDGVAHVGLGEWVPRSRDTRVTLRKVTQAHDSVSCFR
jgi:hypothetical protein